MRVGRCKGETKASNPNGLDALFHYTKHMFDVKGNRNGNGKVIGHDRDKRMAQLVRLAFLTCETVIASVSPVQAAPSAIFSSD
jgi:hypothetical protein